jgi:transposase-like protein
MSEFRVIHHTAVCPECDSSNVVIGDVDTGDGVTETAFICAECGEAWPLACVTDWGGTP